MKPDDVDQPELPWSPEAEQYLLGSLMLAPEALHAIADRIRAGSFFTQQHQCTFEAISTLVHAGQSADVLSVFQYLRDRGDEQTAGGLVYLNQLFQCVPSAANVQQYARIVDDKARRRQLIATLNAAASIAWQTAEPAAQSLDRVASLIAGLRQDGERGEPQRLDGLAVQLLERLQRQSDGESGATVMATGLKRLDKALAGGLRPGHLVVLGARPSVGKTSLVAAVALNLAQAGHPILILSQEMRAQDLAARAMANLASVNLGALISGQLDEGAGHWSRLSDAAAETARLPLWIDDQAGLTLAAINAKARRQRQRHGLAVLVLDYLQLTQGTDRRDNRNLQIEEVSRGLKTLAKELDICVIALAQLNRQSLTRSEPDLGDLRDSGAIEQDADAVLLLDPRGELGNGLTLVAGILAKNRQGRRGRFALELHGATQRWQDSEADVSRRSPS